MTRNLEPSIRRPSYVYAAHALVHPMGFMLVTIGTVGAIAMSSLLFGVAALSVICAVAVIAPRVTSFRAAVDRELDEADRLREDRERRKRALVAACSHRDTLEELVAMVTEIERLDPLTASRLELRSVLDTYAELSIVCSRYGAVVRSIDREQLDARMELAPGDSALRTVLQRRAEHCDACRGRAERAREQLDTLEQFVRLTAERAVVRAVQGEELLLDAAPRLEEAEAADAALTELTAA